MAYSILTALLLLAAGWFALKLITRICIRFFTPIAFLVAGFLLGILGNTPAGSSISLRHITSSAERAAAHVGTGVSGMIPNDLSNPRFSGTSAAELTSLPRLSSQMLTYLRGTFHTLSDALHDSPRTEARI